ncbi:hypothetical protein V8Z80_02975 [Orrella sp. JC864]|uniref:hypothetical protein n=1 Tax=Orrella sp. JC864 TaxID=3120298 RepID=UPI0012BC9000
MAQSGSAFLLVTILMLATVLAIFAMKYFVSARQARLRLADETAYRELAGQSARALREQAQSLDALREGLAEANARLARVEKVLKEVE